MEELVCVCEVQDRVPASRAQLGARRRTRQHCWPTLACGDPDDDDRCHGGQRGTVSDDSPRKHGNPLARYAGVRIIVDAISSSLQNDLAVLTPDRGPESDFADKTRTAP